MRDWRAVDVATEDGTLRVGITEGERPDAPAVLAVHGITASLMAWRPVAEHCPGYRVIAPDLRGRGHSARLPGPYGMAQHADDLARILDALDVERPVVVGHSMGGFVALVFGHRHPSRTRGLLLVDGGVPLPVPPDVAVDRITEAILGPALARLSATFPARSAYCDFWRVHPAFVGKWTPAVEAYVDYDLTGSEPYLRSRVSAEAVSADSRDQLVGTTFQEAVAAVGGAPLRLLRAPLGLQNEPPGLYPEPALEAATSRLPGLVWKTVPDVNHYTVLLSDHGARAVGAAIREAVHSSESGTGQAVGTVLD